MLTGKQLAWVQLIGGLVAGWLGYQNNDWGVVVLAVVMLIISLHHFTSAKK